ncbi:MAG: anaerobic ribonucleoside-triphosphate reductase [Candidatus Diapherotrites archaeon]|nr:anaerobic ribonucleoside-triphosphate reductase [Candidatus Diapherotrites archaeon]
MPSSSSRFNPKVIQDKCSKAGISFWLASEVALSLQEKLSPTLTEEDVNDLVLEELRKRDEEAARQYENYHKVYVRTSDGVMDSFNKDRIVQSLLKETTLPQNACAEIAKEVESDIRRLELRYVSAPLIREMASAKLLERRQMQARADYSRIGIPIYDVTRMLEKGRSVSPNPEALHKRFGDAVAEEYALVKILPDAVSKAHLLGDIHIHDLPYFATRPVSLQNDLRVFLTNGVITDGTGEIASVTGPAKHPGVAISHAVRVLISGETHLSGGQSFDFFNTFLAPYTMGLKDKDVLQIIQTFLYELNQIYAVKGGNLAQSTINFELETPPFLKKEKAVQPRGETSQDTYHDYERESVRFLNLFLQAMAEGDFKGRAFKTPKVVLKVREGAIPFSTEEMLGMFLEKNPITIVNLRNKRLGANANMVSPNQLLLGRQGKWFNTLRTGVMQEVSINLPRIALLSSDDSEFFTRLDTALDHAKEAYTVKRGVIEKRLHRDKILPFLTQEFDNEEYYSQDNAQGTVSIVGLDNAVREYTGSEVNKDKDAMLFADRVMAYITTRLNNYNENEGTFLTFGCLEVANADKRFSMLNEKRFGIKEVYPTRGFTHMLPDTEKWIETEARFQQYCNGAAQLVLETDNPSAVIYHIMSKDAAAFTLKKKT